MHSPMPKSPVRRLVAGAFAAALLITLVGPVAARSEKVGSRSLGKVTKVRTTAPAARAGQGRVEPGTATVGELRPRVRPIDPLITGNKSYAHVPSKNVPRPRTSAVVNATGTVGFNGLNHYDNRTAGGGGPYANSQFSLEPPDQALCVSDSYIVESVNTVVRVRSKGGAALTPAIPISQFFGLAPSIDRAKGTFGPFTADPKCHWDADTGAWFLTILSLGVTPTTGAFSGTSSVLLAVSTSPDPTGTWSIYEIDTTNDGAQGNCPCFGDQPLIGADANGFYITTNVFPLFQGGFNGAMVYAMSKAALAAGLSSAVVTSFHRPTLAEGFAYSLQPATTPPGAAYATENGGTEYFLSALEFTGGTDDRIAVWALTNTASLLTAVPDVSLQVTIVDSLTYGQPPAVLQKDGPTPLLDLLRTDLAVAFGLVSKPVTEHLNLLNSNDDRMNQAVYVNGQVWGALNTAVKGPTGPTRTGIAWFVVEPDARASVLAARMVNEGYVAVETNSVMFPAVAANANGTGLIAFSLAGPGIYPSAAYVTLDPASGTGPVNVVQFGDGPADGFTGYLSLAGGNGVERWGDYSAAAADPAGSIWFATEYIDSVCGLDTFVATQFTCGDSSRTVFANWGTWIGSVGP